MDIKSLPGGGHNFRVSAGAGNFQKKFSSAVRAGDLHNLADNQKTIIKAIKAREGDIRVGKFDRLRQKSVYSQIKRVEGEKLTTEDKIEIKKILQHLGGVRESFNDRANKDRLNSGEQKTTAATPPVTPIKVRINRDPNNNQFDFKEARNNVRTGVGETRKRLVNPSIDPKKSQGDHIRLQTSPAKLTKPTPPQKANLSNSLNNF